jgi:hypothetical protein
MKKNYLLALFLLLNMSSFAQLKKIDGFTLFPNPASEKITVSYSSLEGSLVSIEIIDMIGNSVYSASELIEKGLVSREFPLQSLNNGIYFLKMTEGDNTIVKKFIVKH